MYTEEESKKRYEEIQITDDIVYERCDCTVRPYAYGGMLYNGMYIVTNKFVYEKDSPEYLCIGCSETNKQKIPIYYIEVSYVYHEGYVRNNNNIYTVNDFDLYFRRKEIPTQTTEEKEKSIAIYPLRILYALLSFIWFMLFPLMFVLSIFVCPFIALYEYVKTGDGDSLDKSFDNALNFMFYSKECLNPDE